MIWRNCLLELKNNFECTGNDCMQYRKYKGGRKYLFIQAFYLDENEYSVVADIIDVSKMTTEDIESAICGYYNSIEYMEQKYEATLKNLDWLVAKCAFESKLDWKYGSKVVAEKRAEEIIHSFIDSDGKVFLNE